MGQAWIRLLQEGFADARRRILGIERVFRGTTDAATVHVREVIRNAILQSAVAVVVLHNHPSGDPTPSSQDVVFTSKLAEAGRLFGVDVIDHVVLGFESDGGISYASLRESGYM